MEAHQKVIFLGQNCRFLRDKSRYYARKRLFLAALELFRKLCRPEFWRYPTHSAEKRGMDGARKSIAKANLL
jgi:hypothetical protein